VDSLTGLRIIAAALVFLSHLSAPDFVAAPVATFMLAGYNGVTVFFVLSGFVLAWNYADRLARPSIRGLWSFAVARVARIYPLYLFALLWAAAPALVTQTVPEGSWLHLFALQTWHPDVFVAYALNGPGWSIGVEFFLYACFPLVLLAVGPLRTRPRLLLAVIVGAVVVVFGLAFWFTSTGRDLLASTDPESAHRWLYRTPLTRLGDFVVGVALALLVRAVRSHRRAGTCAQVLGVAAFAVLMVSPSLLNTAWSWDAAYLVPAALVIWGLATHPGSALARLLASKPMVLAGEASFAFYLLHMPLLARLTVGPVDRWYGWVFTTALEFAMIMLVAVGAHIAIERPMQRWIRGALDRRRPSPAEDLVPVTRKEQVLI
jgi:peptidoglycan/LPS O-acetylase OafA/YrhL